MICEFEKQTIDIKDPDMNKLIELLKKPCTSTAEVLVQELQDELQDN